MDNPVALMQFGDRDMCLLLRTHRTRNWLPGAVIRCLMSDTCKKIGVGWDGPDKTKFQHTFHFLPSGIVDLSVRAKEKGIPEQGLKSLSERFSLRMKKDSRIARSNWATRQPLSREQVRYAAEDAYFTYILADKVEGLPDLPAQEAELAKIAVQGALEIPKDWEDQGIVRKHDGLWCAVCDKGPMMADIVKHHFEGQRHRK